ncbi:hypothetical protein [Lacrimispora sp. 38-1]|uniref:hypothetical protein n=1 Tax=Lacrimispora sp. 38-1 TaxID=3125778 RepID=UPI003CE7FFFE
MNTVLKNYRFRSYNKRKKTWRSLKWAFAPGKRQRGVFYLLYCCLLFEAAVLFPRQREQICSELRNLYAVRTEYLEETMAGMPFLKDADGEVRERGLSLDLKEGELKLWQRVERQILKKSD